MIEEEETDRSTYQAAEPEARGDGPARKRGKPRPEVLAVEEPAAAPAVANPWDSVLQMGVALLTQLAESARNGSAAGSAGTGSATANLVQRDERTGETYLKVPMPSPEMLNQALQSLGSLLEMLRK
jgi:hypothetical protein